MFSSQFVDATNTPTSQKKNIYLYRCHSGNPGIGRKKTYSPGFLMIDHYSYTWPTLLDLKPTGKVERACVLKRKSMQMFTPFTSRIAFENVIRPNT